MNLQACQSQLIAQFEVLTRFAQVDGISNAYLQQTETQ